MTATAAAAPEPEEKRPWLKIKLVCSHCDHVFVRHSRFGYTAKCPKCGTVNAGPGLLAEQQKPRDPVARRRARRRAANAEKRAEAPAAAAEEPQAPSGPLPVRRRRPAPAASSAPKPAAAPAPRRRGWWDRIAYGEGDDDDGE